MADYRHIELATGRDTRIATVIMKAVPDTRRLSPTPKFVPYLFVLALVVFSRESWAREVNPEVPEIQNDSTRFDRTVIRQPEPPAQNLNDRKEVRERKTILSEVPAKLKEIGLGVVDDVINSDQSDKSSETINVHSNDEGIRRFDVEINTEEEQSLNDGHVVDSADGSDKMTIRTDDSEHAKSVRDDLSLRKEVNDAQMSEIKKTDIQSESEKPSEISSTLKEDIQEKNPFLKKFLLNKQDNKQQHEDGSEENIRKLRSDAEKMSDVIQRIKEKAMLLQEQIKNATFLQKLKDQATEVLPEIPSFTEEKLLEGLKLVVSQKKIPEFNNTYLAWNVSDLSPLQKEILRCAEELMVQRQRQSFMSNMYQCIRGLSVLNCMRIFVYPVLVENVPQALANNFPIEINVADIIKGNRNKVKSSRKDELQPNDLLTPEWQIYTIFKTMLQNYPASDKVDMFVDFKNETLASLLSPNQILILQMGEHLLPQMVRQEYANQMFSCIRRFEYYSCIKYFAWPMIKHYLPTLPEFPTYYWTPPIIAEYPEVVPYPAYPMEVAQLPEIIDADGTRTRGPKPEIVILRILQNALREQQHLLSPYPTFVDYNQFGSRITRDQLESLRVAEKLLPASIRPDYASKTLSCINQYNYLHCIRHSTWPMVRKYTNIPKLPEFQNWISGHHLPDISGYIPSLSNFPSISSIFNKPHIFGGGGSVSGSGSGSAGGVGVSGSGSVSGGGSDPSGGMGGQIPGYPVSGISGGGSQQLIPPYPFIPFVPYPWYPPQQVSMDPSQSGMQAGGGSQGMGTGQGSDPGSGSQGSTPSGPWDQWTNTSDPNQSGSSGSGSDSASSSETDSGDANVPSYPTSLPCKSHSKSEELYEKPLIAWEDDVIELLKKARNSSEKFSGLSSLFEKSKIPLSLTIRQLTILRLSEDLLPEELTIRQDVTTKMLKCIEENNLFAACFKIIMFPAIKEQTPNFPKLPPLELMRGHARADDDSKAKESSENHLNSQSSNVNQQVKKVNEPVISVTGTRFVPIFTEHPESVIYNILRSIRISDSHIHEKKTNELQNHPELSQILTERQEKILITASELIPNNYRGDLFNKTKFCIKKTLFLSCARTTIWPFVQAHVPELPNFPNFENIHEKKGPLASTAAESLEPTVLETNVEANKHGEHHITITDTRFVPVLSEKPETVVLKILKSIQHTTPHLSTRIPSDSLIDKHPHANSLSPEQINILKTSEILLPDDSREIFVTRMFDCVGQSIPFLDCTRDVAFPVISQHHPTLPSFPHFGPSLKSDKISTASDKTLQAELENALRHTSTARADWSTRTSHVNVENARAATYSYPILSDQQINIIRLSEDLLPETLRISYRARMLDCIQRDSFLSCTQLNWPILKQYAPSLPDFSTSNNLYSSPTIRPLPPFQHLSHLPPLSPIPSVSEITFNNGLSGLPTVVDRRTVLPYDPHRMYRQVHPVSGAGPTLAQGANGIPPYLGQPASNFINLLSTEKINEETLSNSPGKDAEHNESKRRSRRSIVDQSYPNSDEDISIFRKLEEQSPALNITESELLRIIIQTIKVRENVAELKVDSNAEHLIDQIDPNLRYNLTADQYEILKMVTQLNPTAGKAGFMSRLVQCIQSLSFIRCAGIFIWPMISNNLPSLPSLPSLPVSLPIPSIGSFFGRSNTESNELHGILGLTATELENQLIERKNTTEKLLLEWYDTLLNEQFETNLGLIKIRGYGNRELGITFSDRNGRSSKIKSRHNIPRLLTLISEVIKDLFSNGPAVKVAPKVTSKIRSVRTILQKSDRQMLPDARDFKDHEDQDIEDREFKVFLSKFKYNLTNHNESGSKMMKYSDMKEAFKAFDVLFGPDLTHKLINRLKSIKSTKEESKIVPLQVQEENLQDDLKVIQLNDQDAVTKETDKQVDGRRIKKKRLTDTELTVRLPRVNEKLLNRKDTNTLAVIGRKTQSSAMQMIPGLALLVSFVLQMLLAHARAAASVAGMLSNMAMGTAMFGMIRQSLMGTNNHPKIKYVYDNDEVGPGITWPKYHK